MTIDEYLNQLRTFKRREKKLYKNLMQCADRAFSPRSASSYDMPHSKSHDNQTETLLIELADADAAYTAALEEYRAFREQLENSIYNLFYWEGLVIYQVYFINGLLERDDDLTGLDEILKTHNRGVMISKLNEAKQHLRQILIDQGIEIE